MIRRERFLTPLFLMLGAALLLFVWLGSIGARPWGDAGGYEAMLRYFLQTGHVDYMKWSQPTFIGILPVAVPWAWLFGTGTSSLQGVGIFYTLLCLAGLYAFLIEHTRPLVAVLLCACLFCFSAFLPQVPTFMTDTPYLAYLVWFLAVHQNLEGAYAQPLAVRRLTGVTNSRGAAGTWVLWAVLFGLAALTRSFALVLVPVFACQMIAARFATRINDDTLALEAADIGAGRRIFAERCFWMGAGMAIFSVVLTKLLGQNPFSLRDLTVIPEAIATHNPNRLEVRPALISLLLLSVAILPALLLCRPMLRGKVRPGEAMIGLLGLAAGLYFWRKGLLPPFISLPGPSSIGRIAALMQILLVPVGLVWGVRAVRAALHVQATPPMIAPEDGETAPARRPLTAQIVLAVLLAHLLILPVMQHVDYRHLLPSFVAVLMCVALAGTLASQRVPLLASAIILLCALFEISATREARLVNAATFDTASSLRRAKVPLAQIGGGWAWFCAQHLRPGTPNPQSYVTRFKALEGGTRYVVTTGTPPQGARVVRRTVVRLLGRSQTVSAYLRPATSSRRTHKQAAPKSNSKRVKL